MVMAAMAAMAVTGATRMMVYPGADPEVDLRAGLRVDLRVDLRVVVVVVDLCNSGVNQ